MSIVPSLRVPVLVALVYVSLALRKRFAPATKESVSAEAS